MGRWKTSHFKGSFLTKIVIFTARKQSCGKVMFLHSSVSHSVHRRGVRGGGGGGGMHAGEMATEASGTHPTGMHSCSNV